MYTQIFCNEKLSFFQLAGNLHIHLLYQIVMVVKGVLGIVSSMFLYIYIYAPNSSLETPIAHILSIFLEEKNLSVFESISNVMKRNLRILIMQTF